MPAALEEVRRAVATAQSAVLSLVASLARLGKTLHFHLHDGHPLAQTAPYGLSDHLGFGETIIVSTPAGGARVAPMFGPKGLTTIVEAALAALPPGRVSFTLEIHPSGGRLPLGDASALFSHWTELDHAERMNHWLSELARNAALVRSACGRALSGNRELAPRPEASGQRG